MITSLNGVNSEKNAELFRKVPIALLRDEVGKGKGIWCGGGSQLM